MQIIKPRNSIIPRQPRRNQPQISPNLQQHNIRNVGRRRRRLQVRDRKHHVRQRDEEEQAEDGDAGFQSAEEGEDREYEPALSL